VTLRLPSDEQGLDRAAELIRSGAVVAFPTETVYGLGADATDPRAVAAIYAAKERPRFLESGQVRDERVEARAEAVFGAEALALAEAFWPGPLTLVLPLAAGASVSDLARAGLSSIGLRVPAHPFAQDLLRRVGRPVAAPSANRSGRVSPTRAEHVLADLDGRIAAVLDGGPARVGLESTIVGLLDGVPRLLRPGGLARERIEAVLGRPLAAEAGDEAAPLSPGRLLAHYAPQARLRLQADRVEPGEAALLFGPARPPGLEQARMALNLSEGGDLVEAAGNLFAQLRALDSSGAAVIAVSPVPDHGLGEAIADRLRRAAQ
jgi:L-threonylcarbamoyladenylate synthase